VKCGRLILCVAFFSAASLAACGGSATTVPPAAVATAPGYPANGVTYSYASKSWGVFTPAAPATPIAIATSFDTQDETVKTGATYGGRNGLIDVKAVYHNPSDVEAIDEYLQWVPVAGRQALEEIAQTVRARGQTQGAGQTQYTVPAAEVQVPFAAGNHWNAAIAYRETGSWVFAFGGTRVRSHSDNTWNLDGSYSRRGLNAGFVVEGQNIRTTSRVASDGSATSSSADDGKPALTMSIGVPTQTAAGSYVIPIVDFFGKKANIPDWYPGGGLPPSPLVTATIVDRGMEKLPAGCDVPRRLATAGEAIVRTGSQFDPNGNVGTNTDVAYYAPGVGMVCNMQSEHTTVYFVIEPAAKLVAVDTYHAITSLVRLSRKTDAARALDVADALAYAVGAALSDSARRRVHATVQAALRSYVRR
jgi:hypothetical protein